MNLSDFISHSSRGLLGVLGVHVLLVLILSTPVLLAESPDPDDELMLYSAKNLARKHLGAGIEVARGMGLKEVESIELTRGVTDTNRSALALLADDASIGFPVSQGSTSVVVHLPDIEMLQTLSFSKKGFEGAVTAEVSVPKVAEDSSQWRFAGKVNVRGEDTVVRMNMGFADAKYVRLTFDAAVPGRIYGFGVFGESLLMDYEVLAAPEGDGASISSLDAIDLSLAGSFTGARVVYLSNGQKAVKGAPLIDGDSVTGVLFSTDEATAHAVLDLNEPHMMDRASALYGGFKGDVRVYVVDQLPQGREPDQVWLRELTPAAESSDPTGVGIAGMDFTPTTGRYLIFEWEPVAGHGLDALSVSEVGAFSSQGVGGLRVVGADNGGGVSYGKGGYGKGGYGKSPPAGKTVVPEPVYDPEAEMRRELDLMHRHIRGGYFPGGSGLTSQIFSGRPIFGDPLGPANLATTREELQRIIDEFEEPGGGGDNRPPVPPTTSISP
ncbi:MAG: hypothetical protein AAF591_11845 [Verrucomicrobiota bacterium]